MIESAAARPLYSKAPIVEAVIDFRITTADPIRGLAGIETLTERLKSRFPQKQPIETMLMAAEQNDGHLVMPRTEAKLIGWKLVGAQNDRTLMVGTEGFTYSHLPPYTRWEIFKAEAKPLWEAYVDACESAQINRLAVRYINRLKLPLGPINLSDYLAFYPTVPDAVQAVAGLVMQIQIPQPGFVGTGRSVITLASEANTEANWQPMVLDFDVFTEVSMPPNDDVWPLLECLRDTKNELFEACLTDSMRALIQ